MNSSAATRRRRLLDSLERGRVEIRTRGLAMRPLLEPGDRVRLELREPEAGDVALVEIGERWVLHRLVRAQGDTWWVRGDRSGAGIGRVHRDQVVAIATERLCLDRETDGWRALDERSARSGRWFSFWRDGDKAHDV